MAGGLPGMRDLTRTLARTLLAAAAAGTACSVSPRPSSGRTGRSAYESYTDPSSLVPPGSDYLPPASELAVEGRFAIYGATVTTRGDDGSLMTLPVVARRGAAGRVDGLEVGGEAWVRE